MLPKGSKPLLYQTLFTNSPSITGLMLELAQHSQSSEKQRTSCASLIQITKIRLGYFLSHVEIYLVFRGRDVPFRDSDKASTAVNAEQKQTLDY